MVLSARVASRQGIRYAGGVASMARPEGEDVMARYDEPEPQGGDPPCWAHLFEEELYGSGPDWGEGSRTVQNQGDGRLDDASESLASGAGPEPAPGANGAAR